MASTQTIITSEVSMTGEELKEFLDSLPIKPNRNSKAALFETLHKLNSETYYETLAGIIPLKLLSQALVSEDSLAYQITVTRAGNRLLTVEAQGSETGGVLHNHYTLAVIASKLIMEITSEVKARMDYIHQL